MNGKARPGRGGLPKTTASASGLDSTPPPTTAPSGDTEFGPPVPRTRTTRKMADKACYRNAAITAMTDHQWRYAEGMALSQEGWWVHHAWNVDAAGRVLDRTWPEPGARYVGQVIDIKEVARRTSATGWIGPMRPELPTLEPG